MGKPAAERRLDDNEASAFLRAVRTSPRKLNLVAQMIRGKDAATALAELTFSRRRIANEVKKVLEAAIANAENNHQLDVDRLYVKEATVGRAFVMKRFHTAAGAARRASKSRFRISASSCASARKLRRARWDRRSIRSGCGSGSTAPGIHAGFPARNTATSCMTIPSCAGFSASGLARRRSRKS